MKRRIISFSLTIALLFALLPLVSLPISAEDTFGLATIWNGHTYMLFDDSMSWTEAKAFCEIIGGHLVTITSDGEQEKVASISKDGSKDLYWLGGLDEDRSGQWRWITDEAWEYSNWNPKEPTGGQYYLSIYSDNASAHISPTCISGKWMDNPNMGESGFRIDQTGLICEWDTEIALPQTIFNGHTYQLFTTQLKWQEAKEFCERIGGHLVTIGSDAEQQMIETIISSFPSQGSVYIGLAKEDGVWSWVDDTEYSYTHWALNQPDGSGSVVQIYNDSSSIHPNTFWDDVSSTKRAFICEWDDNVIPNPGENSPVTPSWYDFKKDSYNFTNYKTSIGLEYFKTLFGDGKGEAFDLWKKSRNQGGVCFGMAYTTAALLNGFPECSNIRKLLNWHMDPEDIIDFINLSSTIRIDDKTIALTDYIKYAHIYQFSSRFQSGTVWTDIDTIYNRVKTCLNQNQIGITIGMTKRDGSEGHRVLAIGIDGDDILVDDPNNKDEPARIIRGDYGSWEFTGLSGWNNISCKLRYNTDFTAPYKLLQTGTSVTTTNDSIDAESYVNGLEQIDRELLLFTADCRGFVDNLAGLKEIILDDYENINQSTSRLFWLEREKSISILDIKGTNNTFRLAGNDNILSVHTSDSAPVIMVVDEEKKNISSRIDTIAGHSYEVSMISFDSDSRKVEISVSGIADSDEFVATKTESGMIISGLNELSVEYSIDNENRDNTYVSIVDGSTIVIAIDKENDVITTDYDNITCPGDNTCPGKAFLDMPAAGTWSHDPIDWAVVNEVTNGTDATHFSPNAGCTRAQVATFLWRAAGEPAPTNEETPFTDVAPGQYYTTAVAWAVEQGITKGTSDTTFTPNRTCSRAEIVTFLWRANGEPKANNTYNPFSDVPTGTFYTNAVLWAVEKSVTNGTTPTTFSPTKICSRSEIVTFLYRAMK